MVANSPPPQFEVDWSVRAEVNSRGIVVFWTKLGERSVSTEKLVRRSSDERVASKRV